MTFVRKLICDPLFDRINFPKESELTYGAFGKFSGEIINKSAEIKAKMHLKRQKTVFSCRKESNRIFRWAPLFQIT